MGKISKTKTIFWEKAQHVCTVFIKAINKKPFSLATPHLNEAMDQSETPLRLMPRRYSIHQGARKSEVSR